MGQVGGDVRGELTWRPSTNPCEGRSDERARAKSPAFPVTFTVDTGAAAVVSVRPAPSGCLLGMLPLAERP